MFFHLKSFYLKSVCLFIVFCFLYSSVIGQITYVDSAFQEARTLAFSSKYEKSKTLCKLILEKSPNYQDVQVLLGRVYFWNNQTDSAVYILSQCIKSKPYEDAFIALSDILRWSNKPIESKENAENGISFFPASEELMIRKVKALYDLESYKQAYKLTDSLISNNSNNQELLPLAEQIKRKMSRNSFMLSYDYDYFDKQYKDAWHLTSLTYGRQTKYLGTVNARVNIANRFSKNGSQFEMDAYPSFGKKMYAYVNAGYSADKLFPNYRCGISIYRNFKHAFEGELGVRVLYFSKATILYVGSIGKYKGNFWFSLRPTFIASDNGNKYSQSYAFITRYYYKSALDYLTLIVGYGLSPDDRTRETLLQNPDLNSYKISLSSQKVFKNTNIISLSIGLVQSEFYQGSLQLGNDISLGISYQKLF